MNNFMSLQRKFISSSMLQESGLSLASFIIFVYGLDKVIDQIPLFWQFTKVGKSISVKC